MVDDLPEFIGADRARHHWVRTAIARGIEWKTRLLNSGLAILLLLCSAESAAPPPEASAVESNSPAVLQVGSYQGKPGQFTSIQAAVNAARPGDRILIGVQAAEVSPELERSAYRLAQTTCGYCHGVSGRSISPTFPNLAAQTVPYLQAQLHAFRDQTRADPDALSYMWGMSSQLSDATIEAISTYYAAQAPARAKTGDATLMARGKQIFEEGVTSQAVAACATCNGPQARGNDISPRLAGQHADYLVKQALVIQRGLRASPVMHDAIKELSQDQMRAVATYLESLSP
jgi:cytochrome c553